MNEMDKKIKDQPMRSNADSKEAQLKSLIVLQKILKSKERKLKQAFWARETRKADSQGLMRD